jgi:hypothetical protein
MWNSTCVTTVFLREDFSCTVLIFLYSTFCSRRDFRFRELYVTTYSILKYELHNKIMQATDRGHTESLQMLTSHRAKPEAENRIGLTLAAVKHMACQVYRQPL